MTHPFWNEARRILTANPSLRNRVRSLSGLAALEPVTMSDAPAVQQAPTPQQRPGRQPQHGQPTPATPAAPTPTPRRTRRPAAAATVGAE